MFITNLSGIISKGQGIVAFLVNKPDKFRVKLCRSYSVANKVGTLSIMTNTQTKMYVCT